MEKCVNKAFEKGYREETNEDKRTDRGRNVILFVLALNKKQRALTGCVLPCRVCSRYQMVVHMSALSPEFKFRLLVCVFLLYCT